MKRFCLLCRILLGIGMTGLLLPGLVVYGQEAVSSLDHMIPPSPAAAAMSHGGGVDVSLYTGVPSVNIPLWTLQGEVVSVAVSLSYHSNGMRVSEIPGWTGMGWTLHAGGTISRVVHGVADDLPKGYLTTGRQYVKEIPVATTSYFPWDPGEEDHEARYQMLHLAATGSIDLEPDIFSYSFNGHSGQFLLNEQGDPLLLTPDDIRITYEQDPAGNIVSWQIVDERGVTYSFGGDNASEKTFHFTPNGSPDQTFFSAWHIREINTPNGEDHFLFTYGQRTEEHRYPVSLRKEGCHYPSWDDLYKYSSTTVLEKYPRTITQFFDSGEVRITFAPEVMESYPGGSIQALRQIIIDHTHMQAPERRFTFSYSFFPSTGCGTAEDYLPPCKRLRLDKITESAGILRKPPIMFFYDGQPLPPRGSFSRDLWGYYNGRKNETPVPALRVVNSHDTASLTPPRGWLGAVDFDWFLQVHLMKSFVAERVWQLPGADRSPDTVKMQAGLLKRIVWPEGGTTLLEYEPNRVGYVMMPGTELQEKVVAQHGARSTALLDIPFGQEIRVLPLFYRASESSEISLYDSIYIMRLSPQQNERVFTLSYKMLLDQAAGKEADYRLWLEKGRYLVVALPHNEGSAIIVLIRYHNRDRDGVYRVYSKDYREEMLTAGQKHFPDDSSYTVTRELEIAAMDDPLVRFSWYFRSDIAPNVISTATLEHSLTVVQVQDIATGRVILEHFFPVHDSVPYNVVEGYHWSGGETLELKPGRYRLIFRPRVPSEAGYMRAVCRKVEQIHPWALAGGVRLKSRVSLDANNDTARVKHYEYMSKTMRHEWSSGVLMRVPLFYDDPEDFFFLGTDNLYDRDCFPLQVYSLARVEDPVTMGSPVGYGEVTERIPGNGRTVSLFVTPQDYPDVSQPHFPFAPATSFDWRRGRLKEQFVYAGDGRLRQHRVTQYNPPGDSLYSMGMPAVKVVQTHPDNIYSCSYTVGLTRAGWNRPVMQETWLYDTTGTHAFHTLERQEYDTTHYHLKKKITSTSDGRKVEQQFFYPPDRPFAFPALQALLDRHLTGIVLQEETRVDSVVVKGYRVYYGEHGGHLVPDSVQDREGRVYRARTFFDLYDGQGRLVQYRRSDGISHAFNRDGWGHVNVVADHAVYDPSGRYPSQAMVTRYTFDPLWGMTSATDPNGNVTRYDYDALGRLTVVRDPQGRIVKKISYHYRTYLGDTSRPVYRENTDEPSLPADSILCITAPVVRNCPVTLTVDGGYLGAAAQWHWYRDGCAVTPAGTGGTITVYPGGRERYFVRAEGKVNNTSCRSITLVAEEAAFFPDRDTLFVDGGGTSHPVIIATGYTGCEPWRVAVAGEGITVTEKNEDNFSVTVAANPYDTVRHGRLYLTAGAVHMIIPVIQDGTAAGAPAVTLTYAPSVVQAGTTVTVSATVSDGTPPYQYVWEKLGDSEDTWTLLHTVTQTDNTDQAIIRNVNENLSVRCTVTGENGASTRATIRILVAQ